VSKQNTNPVAYNYFTCHLVQTVFAGTMECGIPVQ